MVQSGSLLLLVSYGNKGCVLLWFIHLPSSSTHQTRGRFQPSLLGISILQASRRLMFRDVVALARGTALKDAQPLLDIREPSWASFTP